MGEDRLHWEVQRRRDLGVRRIVNVAQPGRLPKRSGERCQGFRDRLDIELVELETVACLVGGLTGIPLLTCSADSGARAVRHVFEDKM